MQLIIDDRQFQQDLKTIGNRLPRVAADFVNTKIMELANLSQTLVPYGEPERFKPSGELHLRDTMAIEKARATKVVTGAVSYTARYAFDVHENPRSGRTGGVSPTGQAYRYWAREGSFKYLEQPSLLIRATFDQDLVTHIAFNV
jgi:hypothetical protein